MSSPDWSVPAFTVLAIAAAGLLAVLSMRYRRDRRVFMESKDLVSGVVRVFSGRLKKQGELLDALDETMHHVLKTQEEQRSRLERITDHMAQSMDVERRLIGALARLGEKVNRLLSGSVTEEKGPLPEKLTAGGICRVHEKRPLEADSYRIEGLGVACGGGPTTVSEHWKDRR